MCWDNTRIKTLPKRVDCNLPPHPRNGKFLRGRGVSYFLPRSKIPRLFVRCVLSNSQNSKVFPYFPRFYSSFFSLTNKKKDNAVKRLEFTEPETTTDSRPTKRHKTKKKQGSPKKHKCLTQRKSAAKRRSVCYIFAWFALLIDARCHPGD